LAGSHVPRKIARFDLIRRAARAAAIRIGCTAELELRSADKRLARLALIQYANAIAGSQVRSFAEEIAIRTRQSFENMGFRGAMSTGAPRGGRAILLHRTVERLNCRGATAVQAAKRRFDIT